MHRVFDERRYLIPFRAALLPQIFTDVLVIGQGVAGLRAALEAAAFGDVIVAAKGKLHDSNTYWAQGGIAAVIDDADSFESHIQDTMSAGSDLCDQDTVRMTIEAGPAQIDQLIDWGMTFDRTDEYKPGAIALGREGGHSQRRILHCDGDTTGKALGMVLDRQVRANEKIRLFENCFVLDLITIDTDPVRCIGAITHHHKYGLQVIWSAATILASGGAGQVYRESTNPPVATGDGIAMAYRAGTELADMAFMQFHPTTLYIAGASRSLITETVRGEGAHLIDRQGVRFMPRYHDQAELAPRDIVSRAIIDHMARHNQTHVFLDCRHLGSQTFTKRFPGICKLLGEFAIDPATDPIPIHPSAHYMIGGVRTDLHGRTNVRGLYACGEVACNGLHGANRLASNSLLEGLVFGKAAGATCREMLETEGAPMPVKIICDIPPSQRSQLDLADVQSSLRSMMWRQVGIQRTGEALGKVEDMFDFWARYTLDKIFDENHGWQVQNLLIVGALITRAAQWRTESRGTHFRQDHPEPRQTFRLHDIWKRGIAEPTTASIRAESTVGP